MQYEKLLQRQELDKAQNGGNELSKHGRERDTGYAHAVNKSQVQEDVEDRSDQQKAQG